MESIIRLFIISMVTVSVISLDGRILEPPNPLACAQRIIHERMPDGRGYYFSWKDSSLSDTERDWLGARNYCRRRCMESISVETSAENEWVKQRIIDNNIKYVWTSGRVCDFKGCDRPDLLPSRINGWFWTAELQKLAPSNDRKQNDWSESGGNGQPQPDNREMQHNGVSENCIAILNNLYNDGVHWHDVSCFYKKSFVCEENDALLKYVRYTSPNLRV